MPNINLSEERTLQLGNSICNALCEIIKPFEYGRLYEKLNNCELRYEQTCNNRMNHEKEHFPDKLKYLIDSDNLRDELIMNQLSLALIYEKFMYAPINEKGEKIITLNLLLLYELYKALADKLEEDYTPKTKEDEENYKFKKRCFEYALNKVFKVITLEDLNKIKLEYNNLNIEKYIMFCIEKKDE